MEQLADNGNGSYAYVDDQDEARKLFVENLTSTLQVIALDAKIQVDFNLDVVAYYRLIGYENRDVCRRLLPCNSLDFATTPSTPVRSVPPVTARALSATALYAVTFRPNADGRITTVQLRWEDPDPHKVTEIAPLPALATSTLGIWRRTSRVLIPATNWPRSWPNTPNYCATALGPPGPPASSWSTMLTGYLPFCGMTLKSPSSPAWSAGPARSGRWGIDSIFSITVNLLRIFIRELTVCVDIIYLQRKYARRL